MLFSLSGFDVSRASWEFPEGTCAGYNGEKQSKYGDYDDDYNDDYDDDYNDDYDDKDDTDDDYDAILWIIDGV